MILFYTTKSGVKIEELNVEEITHAGIIVIGLHFDSSFPLLKYKFLMENM